MKKLFSERSTKVSQKLSFTSARKIHRKITLPKSLFNKVAGMQSTTFLKQRPQHRCSFVSFAEFLTRHLFSGKLFGNCYWFSVLLSKQMSIRKYKKMQFQCGVLVALDINPFLVNVPILYPLETLENLQLSGDFIKYEVTEKG